MQAQTALLRDPRSVGVARRFETAALVAADVPTERVHTAALLRSELVGNAVLRAPSGIELRRLPVRLGAGRRGGR